MKNFGFDKSVYETIHPDPVIKKFLDDATRQIIEFEANLPPLPEGYAYRGEYLPVEVDGDSASLTVRVFVERVPPLDYQVVD